LHHWYAARGQLVEQIWEEPVEDLRSAGYQDVGMSALWDAAAMLDRSREPITVHHRDSAVGLGQHAGGEQPGHPGA
jgi:hypothetical protein